MDNYKHDIYVDVSTPLYKITRMLRNISQIMSVEMQCFMQVLPDTYKGAQRIFINDKVEKLYRELESSAGDFTQMGHAIDEWIGSKVK